MLCYTEVPLTSQASSRSSPDIDIEIQRTQWVLNGLGTPPVATRACCETFMVPVLHPQRAVTSRAARGRNVGDSKLWLDG